MADTAHCFYCREDLGGKKFVRNEGKPVCVRCYTKFCANSCAQCHRPIPVESKVCEAEGTFCYFIISPHNTHETVSLPTRSSAIRAGSGMRSVSVVPSVTSLWLRSLSAQRTTASCVGSAAPGRTPLVVTAAINPYLLVSD